MIPVILVALVAGAGLRLFLLQPPTRSQPRPSHLVAQAQDVAAVIPAAGATGVALDAPVIVTARRGQLASVVVTGPTGGALSGGLDPAGTTWTSNAALQGGTTYRVTAEVKQPGGAVATARSHFTTLTPAAWVTMSIWPASGLSVGVGQPIVVKLSRPVSDPAVRQALLSRLSLAASQPVPVGAFWFSDTELHLRPQNLWPSGERISFSDNLAGWDAGGGDWGQGSGSVQFSIGDARISTANLATHQMTVTDNGRTVAVYPISAGSPTYPTMNGPHIVMDRQSKVQMVSSTVGIPVNSPAGYNETVYWDVHISDSGEYVHAAPWSVAAQGNQNVSHGCINLSPADAQAFFAFSRVGDIVSVVGGPRPPVPGDHGVMDWTTPWSSFVPVPVSALP